MQFKNKIVVIYSKLNDYGERIGQEEKEMRCLVVQNKRKEKSVKNTAQTDLFDLQIMVACKDISPYKDLLETDALQFRYDGSTYKAMIIAAINDFNGKTKYYDIDLQEK